VEGNPAVIPFSAKVAVTGLGGPFLGDGTWLASVMGPRQSKEWDYKYFLVQAATRLHQVSLGKLTVICSGGTQRVLCSDTPGP